jgi:hypothetical protein
LFCKSVPAIIKTAKKTAALENKTKGNNYAFNISKKLPSLRVNRIDAGHQSWRAASSGFVRQTGQGNASHEENSSVSRPM